MIICKRCSYQWRERKSNPPVQCPKCKSPYWDKERVNENRAFSRRGMHVLDGNKSANGNKSAKEKRVSLPEMRGNVDSEKTEPGSMPEMQARGLGRSNSDSVSTIPEIISSVSLPPASRSKPSMDDLRSICAGNIPKVEIEPEPVEDVTPECCECGHKMTGKSIKGRGIVWACTDPGCPMYGREQKGKR